MPSPTLFKGAPNFVSLTVSGGGVASCCDTGTVELGRHTEERQPLRAAGLREENSALLASLAEARQAAALKAGAAREAHAFANELVTISRDAPGLLEQALDDRQRLFSDALKYLDFAIQVRHRCRACTCAREACICRISQPNL